MKSVKDAIKKIVRSLKESHNKFLRCLYDIHKKLARGHVRSFVRHSQEGVNKPVRSKKFAKMCEKFIYKKYV